jgi:uncharacterized membrane protein YqiK
MADEPNEPEATEPPADEPEPKPGDRTARSDEDTVDWVAEARKWEKQAKANSDAAARLKEIEDSQKTEQERLTENLTAAEKRAADAELRAMRIEVAADKGLTKAQAKYLTGSTQEELEAAADELIELFTPEQEEPRSRVPGKPNPRMRGGGDPTEEPEETDPRKLAAGLPRY